MKYKIYEPKVDKCKICNDKQGIYLPICIIDGIRKVYPVCKECRNKVPYQVIPIIVTMDEGYICLQGINIGDAK